DVLNAVIELYMKDGSHHGLPKIATRIHSFRWELHPRKGEMKRELELVLESFVLDGELKKGEHGGYKPTGKAFTTLGEYSTQSRRHAEISKLQSGTVRATALAAIAAIASATPVIMLYLAKLFNTIKALL
ncbi:hypothetical protein QP417_09750, partial [Enterobacter hormaechei]|nr:hypothetical protein [Enterobacter hormaechei]